ncbi:MAG: signal peptide peptidase SppA [Clostridia bacterium]|nr:signal peptide peptidase SppA [Clostridia bacterium]
MENDINNRPEGIRQGYPGAYRPAEYAYASVPQDPNAAGKSKSTWKKILIIVLVVLLVVGLAGWGCARFIKSVMPDGQNKERSITGEYVGLLYLEGTITDGESGDGYNQDWIMGKIDEMRSAGGNRGIILHVNTPGGSTYATREVYEALLRYKEETGRPVYVYMGSQATSGGYYVSMAADKIYANPECWTGSIGVIISGLYDLSGLMEKYGVRAENITSGRNKDMGTTIKPLTDEQREILQALVDESYDHFVEVVAKGRNMKEIKVRELADGRIYSAAQAKENGLIDEIGSLDDAIADMLGKNGLDGVNIEEIKYEIPMNFTSILGFDADLLRDAGKSEAQILMEFLEEQNSITIEYMAPFRK